MAEAGADGLITMAEADAEVAPEAGAPESGASEPPQMQLAGDHYEDEADVMDDVDEVWSFQWATTRPRKGARLRRRAFGFGSGG